MFIAWPQDRYVRHIEGAGHRLRTRLGLSDLDTLDPKALVDTFEDMRLLDLGPLLADRVSDSALLRECSEQWSALAYRENGGPWLIVWNPWHSPTRTRVSIMEEVAHIALKHRPTKLIVDPLTGLPKRTFTRSKEQEAYGVAAASLVPYNGLVRMYRAGQDAADVARHFGVSEALVNFRTNVTDVRRAA